MPQDEPSVSDQILAEGAPVTLRDGRVLHVRFGLRGVKALEDAFGSTKGIDEAVERITSGEGKSFTDFSGFMAAGLLHEGLTQEDVDDLVDVPRYGEYVVAVLNAFREAFRGTNGNGRGKVKAGKTKPSPGKAGTSSPPLPSGAATKTSGE